jgi:DNA modification methylase
VINPNAGRASVLRANSRSLPLADDSVDLVVTSPPYFALRSYTDNGVHYTGQIGDEPTPAAFVDSLLEVTRECVRVLKPSGSLWVNLGDKYAGSRMDGSSGHGTWAHKQTQKTNRMALMQASTGYDSAASSGIVPTKSLIGIPWRYAIRCIDELGLILRAEIIWSKPNGLPESVTDRVRRSHEQWFHFTLNPRYYSAVDEIREPNSAHWERYSGRKGGVKSDPSRNDAVTLNMAEANPLGKLPGSVWEIPTEPGDSIVRSVLSAVAADALTIDEGERILWAAHESHSWLTSSSPMPAGNGKGGATTADTARPQQSTVAERTGHTESLTPSSSAPSQTDSLSIISAGTPAASDPTTSNPSRAPRTSDARGQNGPTAPQDTAWPMHTPTRPATANPGRSAGPASSNEADAGDSVWVVPTEPLKVPAELGIDHFAAFPTEFPRRIIQGWSPAGVCTACGEGRRPVATKAAHGEKLKRNLRHIPGYADPGGEGQRDVRYEITGYACACPEPTAPTTPAVVLDPFGGTGTTALVAKALGRHGISVDMSADYCRLADWRTNDPDQLAKAMRVDKPIKQAEGQLSMLDLLEDGGAA